MSLEQLQALDMRQLGEGTRDNELVPLFDRLFELKPELVTFINALKSTIMDDYPTLTALIDEFNLLSDVEVVCIWSKLTLGQPLEFQKCVHRHLCWRVLTCFSALPDTIATNFDKT